MIQIGDTIAAIATPLGMGGVGIVRISGSETIRIADEIFCGWVSPSQAVPHTLALGRIVSPSTGEMIDQVLLAVFRAPRSYTREDMVEINAHGGPEVLREILRVVLDCGARLAERGEFTRRAFLNGRIDLLQAEAVLDLIRSPAERSARAAARQLEGRGSREIQCLRDEVIRLQANIEAYIDFPEEEIEPLEEDRMVHFFQGLCSRIEMEIHKGEGGRIVREGAIVGIVGRPNVGKSSLFNALLARERAIVTPVPGTTRDTLEEWVDIDGYAVRLVDTAGLREVSELVEEEGIRRAREVAIQSDVPLVVIDASQPAIEGDWEIFDIAKSSGGNPIVLLNKVDCSIVVRESFVRERVGCVPIVQVSAVEGSGLEELHREIGRCLDQSTPMAEEPAIVNKTRHVDALKKALACLQRGREGFSNLPLELVAHEVREAADALGEIIGITTPAEVLDHIFSEFCVGK
jgi:tRNA modification GTPase